MSSDDQATAGADPEQIQKLPDEDRLKQAADSAQKALAAHSTAQSLMNAADAVKDPKKREKMLKDAYEKEIEAHGNSKKARMLQSGAFQGGVGGAGIGGAVGVGVGTVVGTLVGGITAIPTTGLGALVGSGVGAVHGPFIKLTGGDKQKGEPEGEHREEGSNNEDQKGERNQEFDPEAEDSVPDPEALRKVADAVAQAKAESGRNQEKENSGPQSTTKAKKKPRKLEIRSNQKASQT
ncbi:hypothetical protein BU24DRAFT_25843 [Aaosphaeria arxii CBS 175.79]|uniref:Glycine zipper domain-containing protein n=1 Tax=Aaosphaeria arxii CBS 175.79 TaxID=1450172 RepID=A0A6A5Y9K2_9PLEO|nr:uncharacterized protein BU24DRAFT_25843 [Aaosphaeria arxii CBS 175.79]KAF2021697.1 hypothetical protein BU24DRAFT_25843 [Aaosphaeria arxii CBS 175.79]